MLGTKQLSRGKRAMLYNAAHYDHIGISIPKGEKEKIKALAKKQGATVSEFMRLAVNSYTGLDVCFSGDEMPLEQYLKQLDKQGKG